MIENSNKIETTKGLCIVSLTKHIMEKYKISEDEAFSKLCATNLYKILTNSDSGLYLESDIFLFHACDLELSDNINEMYEYITD